VEEVEEDVLVKGVGGELKLVERPETEEGEPVPEEDEEVVERGVSMSNASVWESTELTFPILEAWRVYPEPCGTTGRVKVMF